VKELKTRNTEFNTYKSNQEKSFKIVLKHIPLQEIIDAIKRDIEKLEHKITNIWNIKKHSIKVSLNMFYVELKP